MINDVEPNKYMLEAVKSRDLDTLSLRACQGSRDLLLNFGTPP